MEIKIGTDFGPLGLNVEMGPNAGPEAAARALHAALAKLAESLGHTPDREVFLWTPEEGDARGYGKNWHVCWESGPFEWAILAADSMNSTADGGRFFCEPHYSFSLSFYDN